MPRKKEHCISNLRDTDGNPLSKVEVGDQVLGAAYSDPPGVVLEILDKNRVVVFWSDDFGYIDIKTSYVTGSVKELSLKWSFVDTPDLVSTLTKQGS